MKLAPHGTAESYDKVYRYYQQPNVYGCRQNHKNEIENTRHNCYMLFLGAKIRIISRICKLLSIFLT